MTNKNPNLIHYRVWLKHPPDAKLQTIFDCEAESDADVLALAEKTYPGCSVETYMPFGGFSDVSLVIYSPNESACNDGAGFWSDAYGWVEFEQATLYSAFASPDMPMATGNDARWVDWGEANQAYGRPAPKATAELILVTLANGDVALFVNGVAVYTLDASETGPDPFDIVEPLANALWLPWQNFEIDVPTDPDWNWGDVYEMLPASVTVPKAEAADPVLAALQATVAAKMHYWDALRRLELKLVGDKELTDSATDKISDYVDVLAAGLDAPDMAATHIASEQAADLIAKVAIA